MTLTPHERVILVIGLQLERDHACDGWLNDHNLITNDADLHAEPPTEEEIDGLIERLELINELEQEAG